MSAPCFVCAFKSRRLYKMIPAVLVMTPKKETMPISPTYAVNPVLKKNKRQS